MRPPARAHCRTSTVFEQNRLNRSYISSLISTGASKIVVNFCLMNVISPNELFLTTLVQSMKMLHTIFFSHRPKNHKEKGTPILFSFLILDQEEHGQAKTMRKNTKCSISNAFSMTIINSHPTKKEI